MLGVVTCCPGTSFRRSSDESGTQNKNLATVSITSGALNDAGDAFVNGCTKEQSCQWIAKQVVSPKFESTFRSSFKYSSRCCCSGLKRKEFLFLTEKNCPQVIFLVIPCFGKILNIRFDHIFWCKYFHLEEF